MSLILAPARMNGLFAPVPNQVETAKIIEHCGAASAEHFDPLLRESPVTVDKITYRSFGAIGKAKRDQDIVAAVAAGGADGPGPDLDNRRSRKEHQEIDEVANRSEEHTSELQSPMYL